MEVYIVNKYYYLVVHSEVKQNLRQAIPMNKSLIEIKCQEFINKQMKLSRVCLQLKNN